MGEEFYCVLKLISGEELFSVVSIDENDGDPIIILQSPVIMKMIQNSNGSYLKVKPWMELASDELLMIKLDKVITMTETKDERLIKLYNHYLNDESEETNSLGGKVGVSTQMGYVSSVEEARNRLENLYKSSKDNKES